MIAGGVGQGMKNAVEPGRSIYYHMVYYTGWYHDVKPQPEIGERPVLDFSTRTHWTRFMKSA